MIHGGSRAAGFLFLGDVAVFTASLWLSLLVRSGVAPAAETYLAHLIPFSFLFVAWVFVFYISGLYGKGAILHKSRWPAAILRAGFLNVILAALFFFLVPGLSVAPKTILALYLVISLSLLLLWRLVLYPRLSFPRVRYRAALIASGQNAEELVREVNGNERYALSFASVAGLDASLESLVREPVDVIVADRSDATETILLALYERGVRAEVIPFSAVYEEVFDRVPLSCLDDRWFAQHAAASSVWYTFPKRAIDIVGALLMMLVTLLLAPFIFLAHRLEGEGALLIRQERIGERGKPIHVYKFRSMRFNKSTSGSWTVEERTDNPVTKVGAFLRRTSLDEFPQFMNVLRGELSLIGPRSDIKGLGERLSEALPYYHYRYLIRPGITGWAQINQQYEPGNISPQSIEETKTRLAYDFYYLANRSFALDLVILSKTLTTLLQRTLG